MVGAKREGRVDTFASWLLVLALVLLTAPTLAKASDAQERFNALHEREWAWRLEQFPLLATHVGEARHNHRLGSVDEGSQRQRLRYWRGVARELRRIDPAELPAASRIDYRIYADQIASAIGEIETRAYLMPVNSDSSFFGNLGMLPRRHPQTSVEDYRSYLARLREIPRWFDEHIALMERGLASGMTPPRIVLQGRADPLAAEAELADPEDSIFFAPLRSIPATIDEATRERLRAEARKLLAEQVQPAYRKLHGFMTSRYLPGARESLAAEALPGGAAYYRQQIRDFVTLDLDPATIHQRGLEEVERIEAEMRQVIADSGFEGDFAAFLAFLRSDPQFYARTPEELLMHAAWIAKRVDAQLPRYFGLLPRQPFGIAPVPETIAAHYTAGRYVGAPLDGREPSYYWVNTRGLEGRPLYALPALTLHEAAPGHHLQIALAGEQGEQPAFRRHSYISAYGEGWALYAEFLGAEMGIYRTPYEHFGRLSYEMWRACRLVIDTGVHSMGWSREQAQAFLRERTALSEHEVTTEVDRYISWPGQALSYKWGEMLIRDLRREAEQRLAADFDLRAFHDRILAMGSVPLSVLEEEMRAWMEMAAISL